MNHSNNTASILALAVMAGALIMGAAHAETGDADQNPVDMQQSNQLDQSAETAPAQDYRQAQQAPRPVSQGIGLVGMEVVAMNGEKVGVVENVLVDEATGITTDIVIRTGGILGFGADHYVVPWDRLQADAGRNQVVLNVGKEQIDAEFAAFEATNR